MAGQLRVEQIRTDPEPFARNLIAQGHRVGDLVFTAGQVAVGATPGEVVGVGDFDAQAEQVIKNLKMVLEAGGSSLKHIKKVTIYVTDMGNLPKVIELRKRHFSPPYPASTLVEVSALAAPELMIEIEAVAVAEHAVAR